MLIISLSALKKLKCLINSANKKSHKDKHLHRPSNPVRLNLKLVNIHELYVQPLHIIRNLWSRSRKPDVTPTITAGTERVRVAMPHTAASGWLRDDLSLISWPEARQHTAPFKRAARAQATVSGFRGKCWKLARAESGYTASRAEHNGSFLSGRNFKGPLSDYSELDFVVDHWGNSQMFSHTRHHYRGSRTR